MGIDFSLVLVIATAVTGVIWAGYVLWEARIGSAEETVDSTEALIRRPAPTIVEYARSFFPVLLIVPKYSGCDDWLALNLCMTNSMGAWRSS